MINGMTGFGSAAINSGSFKGTVEVKSQNHRYLDIVYYLPIGFSSYESKIRKKIQKEIKRGRVSISLKITDKPTQKISFNKQAVKQYLTYAKQIKKEFAVENSLSLSDLIKLPGVIQTREVLLSEEASWPMVEKALMRALASVLRMRTREGTSLKADVSDILRRMVLQVKKIQARSKLLLKEEKKQSTLDEFASFQKSNDINEEVARLKHYVDEFKLLLKSKVSVGKKLDFVAQEMQRETNTIGSKLQDKVVANAVVALKSKIEKLREQAQNIE